VKYAGRGRGGSGDACWEGEGEDCLEVGVLRRDFGFGLLLGFGEEEGMLVVSLSVGEVVARLRFPLVAGFEAGWRLVVRVVSSWELVLLVVGDILAE
jgi:hypothetical protein